MPTDEFDLPDSAPEPTATGAADTPPPSSDSTSADTAPPPTPSYTSAREQAAALGIPGAERFGSDAEYLGYLHAEAQRAPRLEPWAAVGQEYARHAEAFRSWRAQQQEALQQQEAERKKSWWNPPEFRREWLSQIELGEDGRYRAKPNADPSILPKYLAYQQHRRDFMERFLTDPAEALGPMVEERARSIAEAAVRERFDQFQEHREATGYIQDNLHWLLARDQEGQPLSDPRTGKAVLSPAGRLFRDYLQGVAQLGIADSRTQEYLARALTERDVYQARARSRESGVGSRESGVSGGSLRDQLVAAFRAAGQFDSGEGF